MKRNNLKNLWTQWSQLSNIDALRNLFYIFLAVSIILWWVAWRSGFYEEDWFKDVLVEVHGTWFDILILGILLTILNLGTEKKQNLQRYNDEIEDFLGWQSGEAAYRIARNIRRINKLGKVPQTLNRAYLAHVYLAEANLSKANLSEANLSKADLSRTNLSKANLSGSNLSGANLSGANLSQTNISRSMFKDETQLSAKWCLVYTLVNEEGAEKNLSYANLSYANLSYANLSYANLSYADLSYASLIGANLSHADLSGVNFRGIILNNETQLNAKWCLVHRLVNEGGAEKNLSYVDLSYADLSYADLSYADLSCANLSYADLSYADLSYANLSYADLSYADLSYAKLSGVNFRKTMINDETQLNAKWRFVHTLVNEGSAEKNSIMPTSGQPPHRFSMR